MLQAWHRRKALQAFDTHNIGEIGNKEAYQIEFTNHYNWGTNYQQINNIHKFLIPIGPLFHARNNQTIRQVFEIAEDYHGRKVSDSELREAASRISRLFLFPL